MSNTYNLTSALDTKSENFNKNLAQKVSKIFKSIDSLVVIDPLPKQLVQNLTGYVIDLKWLITATYDEKDVEKMEITLTGFNSVLSNIQTNNRDCIELEDVDDKTYHKTLNEVGISLFPMSSLSSTVTCLHDLLDVMNALGYTVVNGEMFWASWWDEKTECGVYPGHIVINWLWQLLVSETRTLYHRLELIQKIPDNFKPAFAEVLDSRNADGLPITDHFTIDRPEEEILAVLEELKNAEWESHKVIKKGLVGDITKEEWLFVTTGKGEPLTRKLPWRLKYACKAFVQQYLKQDYKTAEKVFCIDDGRDDNRKDIVDLRGANNNKRSDICNSKTGTIAKCIRKAKGCLDTAVPLCPKIH